MTRRPSGRRPIVVLAAVLLAVISMSSAPVPAQASAASDAESVIVALVNHDRVARGLVPLRVRAELAAVAGDRAARMASTNTLSHSVGGDLGSQIDDAGIYWYRYGEAIAYTTSAWADSAARTLFKMWMGSDAHRALLMSGNFNYIGVGLALRSSDGRTYGTVVMTESPDASGARSWVTSVKVSGDDITWTWSGSDLPLQTHTAGLRDFDVQVRKGDAPWTTIRNDTVARSVTLYNKVRGTSYALRVRATDRRSNAGAWTTESRVTLP